MARVAAAIFVVAVFGDTALASEPGVVEIKNAFAFELPPVWEVKDFKIEATQNFGTEVEPLYKSRFNATTVLKDDTFEAVERVVGTTVLRPVLQTGHSLKVYGISSANLMQGRWVFTFDLQGSPFINVGQPRGAFPSPTIIQGTEEHASFVARMERERQATLEAARTKAEENRRAREEAEAAYLKRSTEHFSSVERVLTSGVILRGIYVDHGLVRPSTHVIEVSFSDYDPEKGTFRARMKWQSGSVLALNGKVSDRSMTFMETAWIENPKGVSGSFNRYDGTISASGIEGVRCNNSTATEKCSPTADRFSLRLTR